MTAIRVQEMALTRKLLAALAARPRFRVWGVTREADLAKRAPTVSITSGEHPADRIAAHLAEREIYAWHGNFYALELAERLAVEAAGGFVRLGLVHYNTSDEVDHLLAALDEL
jgi:selenocysteine lyase/cysteine desulfurase